MSCPARVVAMRLSILIGLWIFAQSKPVLAQGFPTFGTFQNNEADAVDLSVLNVNVTIPIRTKPAGPDPFTYQVSLNSGLRIVYLSGTNNTAFGPAGSTEQAATVGTYSFNTTGVVCGSLQSSQYTNWTFYDTNGTAHVFPALKTDSLKCLTQDLSQVATDGSGYTMILTKGQTTGVTVYDKSGNKFTWSGSIGSLSNIFTDADGNTVTQTNGPTPLSVTDVFGLTALSTTTSNEEQRVYTYKDANGATQSTTVSSPAFNYIDPCNTSYVQTSFVPVNNVSFPDNSQVSVVYDTAGRPTQQLSRTGGKITYNWTGGTSGVNCSDGSMATLTRTTPDGIWTYVHTPPTTGSPISTTKVTDPAQNETDYTFSNGIMVQRISYQGACCSTPLKTEVTCYNTSETNCTTANVKIPITQKDIYTTLAGMSVSSRATTVFDNYGNVTQTVLYDFGKTSPTKTIDTPRGTWNGSGCTNPITGTNIYDRLCYRNVYLGSDSNGSLLSSETFTYSATGHALTHVMATTSTGIGGPTLTESNSYNSNGTTNTSTDVNGTVTQFKYDGTGGCNDPKGNGLLPTSAVVAGLTTSYQWDCNGGVITQSSDANSQPTKYGYVSQGGTPDPFWRVNSVTDPLNNVTWTTYTPATSNTPETIETALTFGTSTVDTLKTFDGLGRMVTSQRRTAPGATTFDNTVQYTYGWTLTGSVTGRVTTQTIPGGTALTTTQFDALGRKASISDGGGGTLMLQYTQNDVLQTLGPAPQKTTQTEYDAFGRITSVCEVTAGTTSWPAGNCAQTSAQTGYWTEYIYDNPANSLTVTQNAQGSTTQSRSYTYDGLGRLTSETNPEWNSLATSYTYDTDTTCGTSNGDVVKKLDPAGNVTCTAYDSLHRPTSVTHPSGPNAAATPTKTFVYDAATVNGKVVQLAKGRLAEAYTGAKTTDLGFSYDADGRTLDFYESTPHSGGYYDITASYWANGLLNTLKGVGLPIITYGPEGEGRPSTVSASTGVSPVPASSPTVYNPTGQVTDVTFGSSDPVHFVYDNMGRMTQYELTINGTATHGDPSWNPNGSLGSLTITDPFNASDAQTCNYGYDDMARLASVNCLHGTTNVWNQSFTYDPFGNITKSGTISWQPGYNASTNQYLTSANCATTGAAPCYDPDGNLLKDGTDHVYTWDAEGHPVTLDSDSLVYDALGREVEVFKGGAYTEFVFGPTGKLALMNGQTQTKAFVSLPGGTQVKYAGSAISTYRFPDWLGSFRGGSNPNRTYSWSLAFAPFGEIYGSSGSPAWSFTGEEGTADTVSDEYDFLFRKLHSAQGRWISPDPAGLSAVDVTNPQTWNRYAYVANNPLSFVDPLGLEAACDYDACVTAPDPGGPPPGDVCFFSPLLCGGDIPSPSIQSSQPQQGDNQPSTQAANNAENKKKNLQDGTCGTNNATNQIVLNATYGPGQGKDPKNSATIPIFVDIPSDPQGQCNDGVRQGTLGPVACYVYNQSGSCQTTICPANYRALNTQNGQAVGPSDANDPNAAVVTTVCTEVKP